MSKYEETRFPDQPNQEVDLGLHLHGENIIPYEEMVRRRNEADARGDAERAFDAPEPATDYEVPVIVSSLLVSYRQFELGAQTAVPQSTVDPLPTNIYQFKPRTPRQLNSESEIKRAA